MNEPQTLAIWRMLQRWVGIFTTDCTDDTDGRASGIESRFFNP